MFHLVSVVSRSCKSSSVVWHVSHKAVLLIELKQHPC